METRSTIKVSHTAPISGRYVNCSNWCTRHTEGREINCLLTFACEWMRTRIDANDPFSVCNTDWNIFAETRRKRKKKNEAANRHRESRDHSCMTDKDRFNCDIINMYRLVMIFLEGRNMALEKKVLWQK